MKTFVSMLRFSFVPLCFAGLIAALSIFVLTMEVSLGWKILAFISVIACAIVVFEFSFGIWKYSALDSASLIELTEIAQRTPEVDQWATAAFRAGLIELTEIAQRTLEVSQWATAAVCDGRRLRSNDLDVARATDRMCQETRAQKAAIAALGEARPGRAEESRKFNRTVLFLGAVFLLAMAVLAVKSNGNSAAPFTGFVILLTLLLAQETN